MKITDTMAVSFDVLVEGRDAAIRQLVLALRERVPIDVEPVCKQIAEREGKGPGVIPVGQWAVALPHTATTACKQWAMAIGVSRNGVPWGSSDAKAHLIVLAMYPPEAQALHLRCLARIAKLCETESLVESLVNADTAGALTTQIRQVESLLGDIPHVEEMPKFCVLGAGNGGLAMAAHLSITGCKVNLYNRSEAKLQPIRDRGGIDVTGEVDGFAALNLVTNDPAQALQGVDVAMVVVPATGHRWVAETIANHLVDGQVVVLNPGRTGGALEVARVFRERNPAIRPYIAEAQTLLYAARITNPAQVRIFGIKNSVPLATLPAYSIVDVLPVIRKALPQFVPGDNVLKTSLDNIGAVFHPAITVLNAGRIEETHGDFEYYVQGVTSSVAAVLEAVDAERVKVASALGIRANTAREWLYLAYDAAGKTLLDAMRANPGYSGIKAPGVIEHRYLSEDVPTSLVPIASIGEMLGVPMPATRSIIDLASIMHGRDYWREGRTVERLGIAGASVKEIQFLVAGAQLSGLATAGPATENTQASAALSVFDQPPGAV